MAEGHAALCGLVVWCCYQRCLRQPVVRELRVYVECTYGIDLVAEEVYAQGPLVGVRVYVHQSSAHGEVTGLVHIVGAAETEAGELLFELAEAYVLTNTYVQCGALHGVGWGHALGKGLGTGDYVQPLVWGEKLCKHVGAQHLVASVALPVAYGSAERGWKIKHALRAHQLRQVVVQVGGVVAVWCHE